MSEILTEDTTAIANTISAKDEKLLINKAKDYFGAEKIKSYRKLNLSYTILDSLFIYALLFGAIFGVCYLHVSFGLVALAAVPFLALFTGIAFNWINVQIHEASHFLLWPNRRFNDVYCNVVLGSWAFQDVGTYRETHMKHHAHLHTDNDPDLWVYTSDVGTFGKTMLGILKDLALITAGRRKLQTISLSSRRPGYSTISIVCAQSIVLSFFIYWCGWIGVVYYGAYLYGLFGVFTLLVRIRTVVQHYHRDLVNRDNLSIGPFISRTTVTSLPGHVLFGARMDYHCEHHLFPAIPYYNCQKMHAAMVKAGIYQEWRNNNGRQDLCTNNFLKAYIDLAILGA